MSAAGSIGGSRLRDFLTTQPGFAKPSCEPCRQRLVEHAADIHFRRGDALFSQRQINPDPVGRTTDAGRSGRARNP